MINFKFLKKITLIDHVIIDTCKFQFIIEKYNLLFINM
jgi:hypothetical protein